MVRATRISAAPTPMRTPRMGVTVKVATRREPSLACIQVSRRVGFLLESNTAHKTQNASKIKSASSILSGLEKIRSYFLYL
jgi:hypothetical protein